MPPLALVVCPLPADRQAFRAAQALLAELGDGVCLFCPEPYHAPALWHRTHRVLPLADLPFERGQGSVSAPVYLLDGGPGEGALRRYRSEVPGVECDAAQVPSVTALKQAVAKAPAMPPQHERPGPTVEALVLSYKSRDYIAPCLESLLAQDWPDLKITVLDNASGDGTAAFVRQRFPQIEVMESQTNLGFAAGHNVLFARTRADYVALLNHDAVARRNWVSELMAAAQARPDGAVLGGKMLMRRCPTIFNSTGIAMNESGFAADRDIGRPDLDPGAEPSRVFAISGGAMLIRGDVLRQIGGFDPTFFMYVEDVDLCWRARLAGREIYYVPTAVVVHDWHGDLAAAAHPPAPQAEGAIAEREGRRRFMVERNRLQSVVKNWQLSNLWRIWRGLRRHDRGRIAALQTHVKNGGGALPARVLEAVQNAHRWCRRHAFGLLVRRLRAQRLRKVPDAKFTDLIQKGFHEPSGVGDLYAIVDRYCARGRARIEMGSDDQGALGPGWHHPEPGPEGKGGLRWSMAECWFYLQADAPWRAVAMDLVPQPLPTWAELWVDGVSVGRRDVAAGSAVTLRWELPQPVPPGQLAECRVRCDAFIPVQKGMGQDPRELGLHTLRIHTA